MITTRWIRRSATPYPEVVLRYCDGLRWWSMAVWGLFRWARYTCSGCGPRSTSSAAADRQEVLSCHSKANKVTLGSSAGRDPKTLQAADLLDGPLAVTA